MQPTDSKTQLNYEAQLRIVHQKWREGDLRFLLLAHQKPVYDEIKKSTTRNFIIHCNRRFGKSTILLVRGLEEAITKTQARIPYGAAYQKDVREIIVPLLRELLVTCPPDIGFEFQESKGKFVNKKTKSEIVISGLDEGNAENLRGTSANLILLDEAAFVDDLEYAMKSVLLPQLLTTNGKFLIGSTSPRSSGHYFVKLIEKAKAENAYIKRTIYDDSRPEILARIDEWAKETGGKDSTDFRREYLSEIVTDEYAALVPEFTPERKSRIVRKWPKPSHRFCLTVMDLGFVDHTGVVFGYVDFINAKKIIEAELWVRGADSKRIADEIRLKEMTLWGPDIVDGGLVRRYADGNLLTLNDFGTLHKMPLTPVDKEDLQSAVNSLRLEIMQERIVISPECPNLIAQLEHATWDRSRKKFERSTIYGHYDLVAALMYWNKLANMQENPYPESHWVHPATHFVRKEGEQKTQKTMEYAFGLIEGDF